MRKDGASQRHRRKWPLLRNDDVMIAMRKDGHRDTDAQRDTDARGHGLTETQMQEAIVWHGCHETR